MNSIVRRFRVNPGQIHFLRFVLEACDGLAMQTTLNPKTGLVAIACPPDRVDELDIVLSGLSPEMAVRSEDKEAVP